MLAYKIKLAYSAFSYHFFMVRNLKFPPNYCEILEYQTLYLLWWPCRVLFCFKRQLLGADRKKEGALICCSSFYRQVSFYFAGINAVDQLYGFLVA